MRPPPKPPWTEGSSFDLSLASAPSRRRPPCSSSTQLTNSFTPPPRRRACFTSTSRRCPSIHPQQMR
ncbi:hypothetical protein ACHAXT_005474 [Thalassiosira profunda]